MEEVKLRTLSVLVDNEAGVLSQVSRLFSRKGFNVESLAVGATDNPAISRMTIEVLANQNQTNLMCNQLAKMVPVHSVKLLNPTHSIRRELILYKVRAKNSDNIAGAILKDLGAKSLRLLTNNPDKVYQAHLSASSQSPYL